VRGRPAARRRDNRLKVKPAVSTADLTAAALLYVDIYLEAGQTPHEKVLVHDPVIATYDQLRFTNRDDLAVLPPILDMMEFVIDELRAARMASGGSAVSAAWTRRLLRRRFAIK
jgi:hypothetical protein